MVLQIVMLCALLIGRSRAKGKNFGEHGRYMALAVALNAASLATIMLPSLLLGLGFLENYPTSPISIITMLHAGIGTVAESLGIYLVLKWRAGKSLVECLKNKRLMKPAIVLWTTTAVLGILFYLELYVL
ncbi:MAG: hypothetical protein NTV61_11330 [Candidatus Bathyarchaeota archaeon]|nr:hypothetical protein [Candidatus Bathyarchaeota archaeon]